MNKKHEGMVPRVTDVLPSEVVVVSSVDALMPLLSGARQYTNGETGAWIKTTEHDRQVMWTRRPRKNGISTRGTFF